MTVARLGLAALAAAVGVEAAFRVAVDLPLPGRQWDDPVLELKSRQMKRRRLTRCDVAFVGGSTTYASINPEPFARHVRRGSICYNAGFRLGVPRVYQHWVKEFVVPDLRPGWLVLGISAADLNDNALNTPGALESYLSARYRRASGWSRLLTLALETSAAIRYRHAIGSGDFWRKVKAGLRRRLAGVAARSGETLESTASGHAVAYSDRAYLETENMVRLLRELLLHEFSHGGVEFDALRTTVATARTGGAQVAFTWLPVAPATPRFFPGGESTVSAVQSDLRALSVELECPMFVPLADLQHESYFADPLHFNASGSHQYSVWLGTKMAPLLR